VTATPEISKRSTPNGAAAPLMSRLTPKHRRTTMRPAPAPANTLWRDIAGSIALVIGVMALALLI
jgi:hypothetical protein